MTYRICDAGGLCDTAMVDVLIDQPFGISPIQRVAEQVVAFPTPAREQLLVQHLGGENLGTVQVMNMAGQVVRTANPATDRYRFDVSDLAPGMYLLSVQQPEGTAVQRIIKQ